MLDIVYYPDPVLRQVAEEINVISEEIKTLAGEMLETMYENSGIGLAAPQVGVSKRLVVIDLRDENNPEQFVLINPVITYKSKEKEKQDEGCLSLPEIGAAVSRPARVKVTALDIEGNEKEYVAEGLFARCLQHEIDHLDGIVFTDKISLASKMSVRGGLRRLEEEYMRKLEEGESK